MFEEYQNKVLAAYQNKIANGKLLHLLDISPAMLREECLNIFKERYDPAIDDVSLRKFFGVDEKAKGYLKIIDGFPTDKFRSLVKFFRKEIIKPDRQNIELLAWLIDFQPRPYQPGDPYDISRPGGTIPNPVPPTPPPVTTQPGSTEIPPSKSPSINGNIKKAILAFIAAAVVCGGTYIFSKNNNQGCMYWKGDHYEPISCNEKAGDTLIIALDTFKMAHFRRITRPDTLTEYSINKVWRTKVNGKMEFYTDSADHPIDRNRRLIRMSDLILNKYAK